MLAGGATCQPAGAGRVAVAPSARSLSALQSPTRTCCRQERRHQRRAHRRGRVSPRPGRREARSPIDIDVGSTPGPASELRRPTRRARARGSDHSVSSSTLRQRKTPPTRTTASAAMRRAIDPVWRRLPSPLDSRAWNSRRTTFRRLAESLSRKGRVTFITWARSEMSGFGPAGCAAVESGYCAATAVEPPVYPEIAQAVSGNARSSPVPRHKITPRAQRGRTRQAVLHGRKKMSCVRDNPEHPERIL